MNVHIEDRRLLSIREKVEAGERLSYDDGVDLYRTADLLALGACCRGLRARAQRAHDRGGQRLLRYAAGLGDRA